MKKNENSDVISASEIGQFYFCSKAWYLQKKGFKPKSKYLEKGVEKHREIGNIIENTNKDLRKSNIILKMAYLILIISIIILILEVIL